MTTATLPAFRYLPEHPDNPHRLGRHQMHDLLVPEKEARPAALVRLVDVDHKRLVAPFNQGQIGSCTGNACVGCLMTEPFHQAGWDFTEATAVQVYELETTLDDSQIPGVYPPDDTGSTGPWSMMAAEKNGWIRSWKHTRSLHTALGMLMTGPISIGVPWYQSMFTPDKDGVLVLNESSGVVGGHQLEASGVDVARQRIRIPNSWDTTWGLGGYCWMPWSMAEFLLHEGGDVVQPVM